MNSLIPSKTHPPLKIIFMGTPDFSIKPLKALLGSTNKIIAIYSQPPRKSGRGMKENKTPVHAFGEDKKIPIYTPQNFKNDNDTLETAQENKIKHIIKKLNLKIVENKSYLEKAFLKGIPIEGLNNLQNQLFGLEINFEKLNAIDFKKGCYVGQENTARMKLKNKIRRQLMSIKIEKNVKIGDEIKYNDSVIGRILIDKPYPFGLIKLFDPDFSDFRDKKLKINDNNAEIIS